MDEGDTTRHGHAKAAPTAAVSSRVSTRFTLPSASCQICTSYMSTPRPLGLENATCSQVMTRSPSLTIAFSVKSLKSR